MSVAAGALPAAASGATGATAAPGYQDGQRPETLSRWRSRPLASWICIAAYAVLAVIAFAPVSPLSSTHLPAAGAGNPAGSDAFQMSWFLAYVPYALTHGKSLFHTDLIFYPNGVNLADNTPVPFLGVLGWPITATLGPVATFNFLIRLSFLVSPASMYLVLGRWCRTWPARFAGGLLYGLGPYMAGQAMHLDLVFVPIPPLLVLLGDELVRRRRMRPVLLGSLIGLAAGIQYWISPDVLSGCGVIAVIVAGWLIARHRAEARAALPYVAKTAALAVVVFLLIAGYPIYEIIAGPGREVGPVIQLRNLQGDSADLFSPLMPTSTQLLTPPFISHWGDKLVSDNLSEAGSYLGMPFLIVLYGVFRRLRHDTYVSVFAAGAIGAWVMSLGAHLYIAGWPSPIPLPGDITAHLPLLENTIPARYSLYTTVFVAIILAIAIERLWLGRPEGTPPSRRKLAVVSGIVVLTLLPNIPFASTALPWPTTLPPALERLLPSGSVVATFPETTLGHAGGMTWQAIDQMSFKLIGGYANFEIPGAAHGQKTPWPIPPPFEQFPPQPLEPLPGHPKLHAEEVALVKGEEAQFRAYLTRYTARAFVFTNPAAPSDAGLAHRQYSPDVPIQPSLYWFYTDALGAPAVTAPGYVIWLRPASGWRAPTP